MRRNIFDEYLKAKPIFKRDRDILRASYLPEELPHRTKEIDNFASILVTALRGERPSNILIYGKTGTGKTAVVKFVEREIQRMEMQSVSENRQEQSSELQSKAFKKIDFIYINCEVVDTQYGILQNIGNNFIETWSEKIPFTGWPTEMVYSKLQENVDKEERVVIIVLDEIDKMIYKSGDDILYHLSRINESLSKAKVSLVGISNNLKFTEFLDARVKSGLGEEKMVFPPYNAEQLKDILYERSKIAFESKSIDDGVVELCAAMAAQEHGDARRALDLLRVAAELTERRHDAIITEYHVNKAKNKIELDCINEVVRTLPTHTKLVLHGIILKTLQGPKTLTTGEVYDSYKALGNRLGISTLTQRRITDLISELDMLGIINARLISKGRYGRTREIMLSVDPGETKKVVEEDELLSELKDFKLNVQLTLL